MLNGGTISWRMEGEMHAGSKWRQTSVRTPPHFHTMEAWSAPLHSDAQPWQVGGFARRQEAHPRLPLRQRFSRFHLGETHVWSMGIAFSIMINKQVAFPAFKLSNYQTSNLQVLSIHFLVL
jgi:hypothetical protein